mgnify:CR=1 FL=1
MLTEQQIEFFHANGYLVVENAVSAEQLDALRADFGGWVEESRQHQDGWGETVNGKTRFDVEKGHNADKPALRRINAPHEVSDAFFDVMSDSVMTDMVADLIGPDVKLHHTKVNSKLPCSATAVKWHQDFLFQPMTNDDMITCLLFIDDVTAENGPLEVIPGSHKGPLYSHWHDGVFTGAVDDSVVDPQRDRITSCTGKAGSVCLMHVNLLHGSAPNLTDQPRTLYITTYCAEDAFELSPNHLPSRVTQEVVSMDRVVITHLSLIHI